MALEESTLTRTTRHRALPFLESIPPSTALTLDRLNMPPFLQFPTSIRSQM